MNTKKEIENYLTDGTAKLIHDMCEERINKRGLSFSGSCRGCMYRYRGESPYPCCIFADLPYEWEV